MTIIPTSLWLRFMFKGFDPSVFPQSPPPTKKTDQDLGWVQYWSTVESHKVRKRWFDASEVLVRAKNTGIKKENECQVSGWVNINTMNSHNLNWLLFNYKPSYNSYIKIVKKSLFLLLLFTKVIRIPLGDFLLGTRASTWNVVLWPHRI